VWNISNHHFFQVYMSTRKKREGKRREVADTKAAKTHAESSRRITVAHAHEGDDQVTDGG
jgi:hypothetical protein